MKQLVRMVLLFTLLCCIFSGCIHTSGYTILNGQYTETDSGEHIFSFVTDSGETEQVLMTCSPHGEASFEDLQTGDRIQIKIVLIKENDGVLTTEVFECKKIG